MITKLPEIIIKLEKEESYTSSELLPTPSREKIKNNFNHYLYLFHGIRFDKNLEKLEGILKERKILSGQYIKNYYAYSENVNKGEYVSLLSYSDNIAFQLFVLENISLFVYPDCDATLTKYVNYDTWELIKNIETKNIYSYLEGEFLVKDYIDLNYVAAIGVPYKYYIATKGIDYANNILNSVSNLIDKYMINIPLVDTTNNNQIIQTIKKSRI